jgi:hypothetical protein
LRLFHINISSNESADREAKKGRISSDFIAVGLSRTEIRNAVRRGFDVEWREECWITARKANMHIAYEINQVAIVKYVRNL